MSAKAPITQLRRADFLVAAALLLLTTAALLGASRSQGYTRDEGYYFQAAEQHVAYLEESLQGLLHGKPLTNDYQAFSPRTGTLPPPGVENHEPNVPPQSSRSLVRMCARSEWPEIGRRTAL